MTAKEAYQALDLLREAFEDDETRFESLRGSVEDFAVACEGIDLSQRLSEQPSLLKVRADLTAKLRKISFELSGMENTAQELGYMVDEVQDLIEEIDPTAAP